MDNKPAIVGAELGSGSGDDVLFAGVDLLVDGGGGGSVCFAGFLCCLTVAVEYALDITQSDSRLLVLGLHRAGLGAGVVHP